jgi:hypothetical protein
MSPAGSFISAREECDADRIGAEEGSVVMANVVSLPEIKSMLRIEILNIIGSDQQIRQGDHLSRNWAAVALRSTESVHRHPALHIIICRRHKLHQVGCGTLVAAMKPNWRWTLAAMVEPYRWQNCSGGGKLTAGDLWWQKPVVG